MTRRFAIAKDVLAYEVIVKRIITSGVSGSIFECEISAGDFDAQSPRRTRVLAPTSVLGNASPAKGDVWQIRGSWRTSALYGAQFHASWACRPRLGGRLLVDYLANHVPGIGTVRAQRLWDEFGEDLPTMLDAGDLAALAAIISPRFPSLSARLAADMILEWRRSEVEPAILAWLNGLGFSDVRVARKMVAILGGQTRVSLEANPYIVAAFLSNWQEIDDLGRRLGGSRAEWNNSPNRLVGAVDFVLRKTITNYGHTVIDEASLRRGLAECLRTHRHSDPVNEAIRLGTINGAIIDFQPSLWRAPGCATLESALTTRFKSMLNGDEPSQVFVPSRTSLEKILRSTIGGPVGLHAEQAAAVLRCIEMPLAVLTGGAGVGKTTTVRAIVDVWEALGGNVQMVALAGKAALRMSQTSGRLARTIHRFMKDLERNGSQSSEQSGFARLDAKSMLIVDEASMVDLGQFHKLIDAMPAGCRLLLVGDVAQLPPIGFGLVFQRLALAPHITTQLTTIHRQQEDSGIPQISKEIRLGIVPNIANYSGPEDGIYILPCPACEIPQQIEKLVSDLGGFGWDHSLQLVSPVKRGISGVDALNRRFHELAVTGGKHDGRELVGFLGEAFVVGEPIVFNRNDYQRGLFNGSLGHVTNVDVTRRRMIARFGEDDHEFVDDELMDLSLAYCMTCHRLQGSQVERIIVALLDHYMVDVSWIYTAVTRAERQVVLVGNPSALRASVHRPAASSRRRVAFDAPQIDCVIA